MAGRGRGLAACLAAALLAGCNPLVQGNGVYAEESRPNLGPFDGIEVADGLAAEVIVAGEGEPRTVKVTGDANLIPHIETTVALQTLHVTVTIDEEYSPVFPLRALITVPTLSSVAAEDGPAPRTPHGPTTVGVNRAAGATFTGGPLSVTLRTAALDATGYPVESASVDLSGSGSAKLRVTGEVAGTVSGGMLLRNVGPGPCNVTTSATTSGAPTLDCSD
jgi:hypothetical protein